MPLLLAEARVAVTPMGAGDLVRIAQVDHDAGGDRLFADIEVERAGDLARLHQLARLLLEGANPHHPAMDVQQYLSRNVHHIDPLELPF